MKAKNSEILVRSTFMLLTLIILDSESKWGAKAVSIPAKFDGFVFGKTSNFNPERILIEAFFDPVCPDSRDAWPPLKRIIRYYGSRVSLTVHPFPLPYHDHSFVTSRALHIVNELNNSSTYPLWEKFFKLQERFYNDRTINMSRSEIVDQVSDFVSKLVGDRYYSSIKSGFNDRRTDLKTRFSFKYGCSRGVFGTPMFFVNGFALSNVGSPIDYNGWRAVIDTLVRSKMDSILPYGMETI